MGTINKSLAENYPKLIKSWNPYKNGKLTPYDVAPYSNKKVWWICENGHEWQASVANRTGINKTGCPYCSGRKARKDNNFAVLFPNILKEWDFDKNCPIKPTDLMPNSHKKVWWKCKYNHKWRTGIVYRTKQKSGCPYCSGKLADSDNSLAALYPDLSKEWDPEKNGDLIPNDVRPGTDRKVWWICSKGHSWKAAIYHRTMAKKPTGCPYCSGREATNKNNLAVLFPELIDEWNKEKNLPLHPESLKPGSNKKVWWKCFRGHEWKISPNKRTGADKTGCPYCNPQTSRFEIRILCELKYIFRNVKWREKINGIEIDVYVPRYYLGVEVDGYHWHIGKEDSDKLKSQELRKHGIKVFRLRDKRLNPIEDTDTFCDEKEDDIEITHRLVRNIMKNITLSSDDRWKIESYLKVDKPQNKKEYEMFLSYLPSPPPEYSLAELYKDLKLEWHYEKNAPLTPENFTPSASANVWWKCPNGHEYKSFLYNRIKGVGCPYCAGKKVSLDNNLAVKAPKLINEWHFKKNDLLRPENIYYRTTKKVWWICAKGHEWQATPQKRVLGSGCPYCAGRK
jgi:hypothetical protein